LYLTDIYNIFDNNEFSNHYDATAWELKVTLPNSKNEKRFSYIYELHATGNSFQRGFTERWDLYHTEFTEITEKSNLLVKKL
jgi:hypothetical protein